MSLELLHEDFKNEVEELESMSQQVDSFVLKAKKNFVANKLDTIISNLNGLCDSLYSAFENDNSSEYEKMKIKYEVMLDILNEKLSDDDKLYYNLKHGIEL